MRSHQQPIVVRFLLTAMLIGAGFGLRDPWPADEPRFALIAQDMSSLKHIMWNYVGLVRTQRRLDRAIEAFTAVGRELGVLAA